MVSYGKGLVENHTTNGEKHTKKNLSPKLTKTFYLKKNHTKTHQKAEFNSKNFNFILNKKNSNLKVLIFFASHFQNNSWLRFLLITLNNWVIIL